MTSEQKQIAYDLQQERADLQHAVDNPLYSVELKAQFSFRIEQINEALENIEDRL